MTQPSIPKSLNEIRSKPVRINEDQSIERVEGKPRHFEEIFTRCHTARPQVTSFLTGMRDDEVNIIKDHKHLSTFSDFFRSDIKWIMKRPLFN